MHELTVLVGMVVLIGFRLSKKPSSLFWTKGEDPAFLKMPPEETMVVANDVACVVSLSKVFAHSSSLTSSKSVSIRESLLIQFPTFADNTET